MDDNDYDDIFDLYLSDIASQKILSDTSELTDANLLRSADENFAAEEEDFSDVFGGMAMQDFENDLIFSNSDSESTSTEAIKEISDQQIKDLPVQELNKLLRNLPRDTVTKIRKRRRNLKNRGYALTCRLRRVQQHEDLENENVKLKSELEAGKEQIRKILSEKESYKRKYLLLRKVFTANRKDFKIPVAGLAL